MKRRQSQKLISRLKGVEKMKAEKVGELIYYLRKERQLTQKQVAAALNISDKTVSKWECGLGCPDISVLPELADFFHVSIDYLLSGELNLNEPIGGNMKQLKFYVCPQCGNIATSLSEATLSCCHQLLQPLTPQKAEAGHELTIEEIDGEFYLTTTHEMKKEHYVMFTAYIVEDTIIMKKQYPEWQLQFRIPKRKYGRVYYYCKKHGLFYQLIK